MTDTTKTTESTEKKVEEVPKKSFSINSILARVTKEKEKEQEEPEIKRPRDEDHRDDEDIPAVVSKLEMPMFPYIGKNYPSFPRAPDGNMLSLGHLPVWYHWYASQHCLQQLQAEHKKSMLFVFGLYFVTRTVLCEIQSYGTCDYCIS